LEFKEDGKQYKEKIIFDDLANVAEYDVPKHGDLEKASYLVDYNKVSPTNTKGDYNNLIYNTLHWLRQIDIIFINCNTEFSCILLDKTYFWTDSTRN